MKIDLHIHSDASFDSTQTVDDIIQQSCAMNLDCIAICDHNEYKGSLLAQSNPKIEVISGIEIDCSFGDRIIHVLGYGCNLKHPQFEVIKQFSVQEAKRIGIETIQVIEEYYGIKIDEKEIIKLAIGKPYTNVEITQYLLKNYTLQQLEPYQTGERSDSPIANFYWDLMYLGKPLYVKKNLPQYIDIINLIHEAKGIAIVAHPNVNLAHDEQAITKLVQGGIDGFEVFSSYHNEGDRQFYLNQVGNYNLIYTCGSDYHGSTKPNIKLGETGCIEQNELIYKALKERICER